jgi:uncharacterized protein (TIGR03083 family)
MLRRAEGTDHVTAMQDVCTDLIAEGTELHDLVADLTADQWAAPTPAPGWSVRHQIAHLAYVTRLVRLAAGDPDAFAAEAAPVQEDFQAGMDARLTAYGQAAA